MPRPFLTALAAGALVIGGLAACSGDDDVGDTVDNLSEEGEEAIESASSALDEGTTDAAEAAARTLAAQHGAREFEDAGAPIDGELTCEASATDGNDAIDVTCTGTTSDGGRAELAGTTSELPGASATELEGDFTGTVDGDEVFQVDRLGG